MNVDLARIQFAFTTINHFFFVPITMGLALLTALLQTAWHRSRRDEYLRLTRFFGTLLVINIAIGVVTGIGLWLFGWNRLSRRVHLATIWLVALGSALSAMFILAANSWMQHPVGYVMTNGKPVLNDIWAVFTNPVFVWDTPRCCSSP
ncbi:MAG TPA: cytochrome ubiquinol oxidase subunit I [Streptosporangiaceae bacterium]|nr:cytochrome ubiquinol oxidase subunit I [Streptosporangiaceae bacterium]